MRNTAILAVAEHSEAELVAGAKRGDEAAIRAIIRIYNQSLFRLARGILADDEAEDALQEAYLSAFRGIAEFRGEASLRTWLGRIVVNAARERLRRRGKTVLLDIDDVIAFPRAAGGDPESKMAQDQVRKLLEQAIDELPPAFRSVAIARLIEEMSVEETAAVLDLRPETVKTRLHRARRLLQAAVERRIGAVMTEAFPFGDQRCQRVADRVIEGLDLRS
jgi:RNA polymerase sigma-70 factor (ECF subfamily)